MKHKLLTVFLTILTVLCLCLGIAACDSGSGIKSVEIDEEGHLQVTLGDGTVLDAGKVTADGKDTEGIEGAEGLQYQKRTDAEGNEYAAVVGLGTVWETDIVIPSTFRGLPVKEIGDSAFSSYQDARNAFLTSIVIPDSVTSIGGWAFSGCSGLTNIEIPAGVTSIGREAFSYCSELTSITIPNSVTEIGDAAFYRCSGLTSVSIGDGVTEIGDAAFRGCIGLTSIVIGDSVTSIGSYAFEDCTGLTNITISDSVTSIGDSAFSGCSGLTSVTIPDSVTEIGSRAFDGCSGLKNVYYMGTPEEWSRISTGYDNYILTDATRYYYSAEENYDGRHWHYDPETNQPVVWTKEGN